MEQTQLTKTTRNQQLLRIKLLYLKPATQDEKITDKIDTNDICYVGENPTAKGVGTNPSDGVLVNWEKSFDEGTSLVLIQNLKQSNMFIVSAV